MHLYDRSKELIDNAIKQVIETIELYDSKKILRGPFGKVDQIKLVHPAYTLGECIADTIHVQECVFEVNLSNQPSQPKMLSFGISSL